MKQLFVIPLFFISFISFSQAPIMDTTKNEVFVIIEHMPEFPDGEKAMRKFIRNNFKYPNGSDKKVKGSIYVEFIVDKIGILTSIKIKKDIPNAESLNDEAIRVFKIMPKWNPGIQNRYLVNVRMIVPVKFPINENK
jgi:protein TonB